MHLYAILSPKAIVRSNLKAEPCGPQGCSRGNADCFAPTASTAASLQRAGGNRGFRLSVLLRQARSPDRWWASRPSARRGAVRF